MTGDVSKKLRQLCISSTQYDACTACVHTIGVNMPINSPPDDAVIAFWQPDELNRIWVLPASKCNWENYNPKTWHAVMYSSVHHSFSDRQSKQQVPPPPNCCSAPHNHPPPTYSNPSTPRNNMLALRPSFAPRFQWALSWTEVHPEK